MRKAKNMEEKKFLLGKATQPIMDDTFGFREVLQADSLDEWKNSAAQIEVTEKEKIYIEIIQSLLIENRTSWQEQELSLHFIGPLFSLVDFTERYKYNLFAQRTIEAKYGDWLLTGQPDGLIASGYYAPKIPYFAFSEYKRQRDPNGDPAGQVLAAMLAGQVLNNDFKTPIYGCYVVGTQWYFMTLIGKNYCNTDLYDSVTDDVFDILKMLKSLKNIIEKRVG